MVTPLWPRLTVQVHGGLSMPGSVRVGRVFGIAIELNVSWLLVIALFTMSLALGWFPQAYPGWPVAADWLIGALSALLLFGSVLLHELAHSLVARARGLPVSSITLFFFGGVSNLQQEPHSPGEEFAVAIIGPITSLVIGASCWLLGQASAGMSSYVAGTLDYLGVTNMLLALFNLIPGFPLDGGRVLRSVLWRTTGSLRTATRWASAVGDLVAYLFIFWGVLQVFNGNLLGGLWIGFIGWFLLNAAQAANTQVMLQSLLRGATVARVMRRPPPAISPDASLQEAVDGYLLPQGARAVPVIEDGQFVGLLTVRDLRHMDRGVWLDRPVRQVMIPLAKLYTATPDQELSDALQRMVEHDVHQMPVIQDRRLVGMLARDAILHFLQLRRDLGVGSAKEGLNDAPGSVLVTSEGTADSE